MERKLENDHNFVRFLIEPVNQDAKNFYGGIPKIQKYILDQICDSSGTYPHFGGKFVYSAEGAIIINPHVDTVSWLKEVIEDYTGPALRITNFKDSPQYTTKVKGRVPKISPSIPLDMYLELLQAQNAGLRTDTWRILEFETNRDGHFVTFLIDDPGRKVLEENGFRLFFGFSMVTFEVLERVKRCERTGKIVRDNIQVYLEED